LQKQERFDVLVEKKLGERQKPYLNRVPRFFGTSVLFFPFQLRDHGGKKSPCIIHGGKNPKKTATLLTSYSKRNGKELKKDLPIGTISIGGDHS